MRKVRVQVGDGSYSASYNNALFAVNCITLAVCANMDALKQTGEGICLKVITVTLSSTRWDHHVKMNVSAVSPRKETF